MSLFCVILNLCLVFKVMIIGRWSDCNSTVVFQFSFLYIVFDADVMSGAVCCCCLFVGMRVVPVVFCGLVVPCV